MMGHYHIQAFSGKVIKHSHRDAPKGHEHDGKRGYSRTLKGILEFRENYFKRWKDHLNKEAP